jgi:hypothetical protein
MNTPRTKSPKRWKHFVERKRTTPLVSGHSSLGINNPNFLQRIGAVATAWPFLEEAMADIFRELVGAVPNQMPYRHILREIISAQARIKLMRSLLENHPLNMAKGADYDKIIDEFESLNKIRNAYIHGLWSTHESGKVYLSSPEGDQIWFFDNEKEVRLKDMDNMLERMRELKNSIRSVAMDGLVERVKMNTPVQ